MLLLPLYYWCGTLPKKRSWRKERAIYNDRRFEQLLGEHFYFLFLKVIKMKKQYIIYNFDFLWYCFFIFSFSFPTFFFQIKEYRKWNKFVKKKTVNYHINSCWVFIILFGNWPGILLIGIYLLFRKDRGADWFISFHSRFPHVDYSE